MLLIDHIYKKQRTLEHLPRRGKRIPLDEQQYWLGEYLGYFPGGFEIWRWRSGMSTSYNIFNPVTRRVEIAVSGTRYITNPNSFKIYGVYARPKNQVRAVEVYEYLIKKLNLVLVSDKIQSPGGQRIWRELKRKSTLNVYGYNLRTHEAYETHGQNFDLLYVNSRELERAEPGEIKDLQSWASNIRLVARQA
jgi:hypothetical protein